MILKFKRDKERKGSTYKSLTEEVLGEGVEVRALTAKAALKVKSLDKITDAEELVTALRQQCEVLVAITGARLQKPRQGHRKKFKWNFRVSI